MCLMEKICVFKMSFIQAGAIVLLAVSSMLMNQHYICYKGSLNRNTFKIRLCVEL